ncbi:hypothetical protein [Solidesulfovibrio sp. C21]|uniref:hypothetical protein n=1 Tax=Solidesulfovibrio sp. C21 TaxID=3398613 RepID=UPI0039FD3FB0
MTDSATTAMRLAGLGVYANVAEDGTLCFVSDKTYRQCAGCGTVFSVPGYLMGLVGVGKCPFCGCDKTIPLKEVQ